MSDPADKAEGQGPDEPQKIIIDEDWKSKAEAEKEDLARQAGESAEPPDEPATATDEPAEQADADAEPEAAGPLPDASITVLISQWASQALMGLGEIPNPVTSKQTKDLEQAKFGIDMLGVIEQKTQGNLSPEEKQLLDAMLFELRMKFVNAS